MEPRVRLLFIDYNDTLKAQKRPQAVNMNLINAYVQK
jgi:hypothetical protein